MRATSLVGLVSLALLSACKLGSYCLDCESGNGDGGLPMQDGGGDDAADGPSGDGGTDGGGTCNPALVGQPCPNQTGECTSSITQCQNGHIVCMKGGIVVPRAEICDAQDNDCNGSVDDGDPGGGGRCGNGTGTCVRGVEHCVAGGIQCQGGTGPTAETCNGLDDDCDGTIDDGLATLGACGTSNIGQCRFGVLSCVGGTTQCAGAVLPIFELCNSKDDDCDGKVDEGFDTQTDALNCGACGNKCGAGLSNGGNAVWSCAAGACAIASCKAGYHDIDHSPVNGCESGQCFITGAEVCDGVDNDCDGVIDEQPDIGTAPAICETKGECAGTVAVCPCANTPSAVGCANPAGWTCTYKATVQVDANGVIIPETLCDGLDNDCNGTIDDHQPQVSHPDATSAMPQACNDGKVGTCEGFGHFACDSANASGPAVCTIMQPGGQPMPELCNGKDDDCDGKIDETAADSMIAVTNGAGVVQFHIDTYEASHPDATTTTAGISEQRSCSNANVLPWTNITEDDAAAACAAAGKRLCTSTEWQLACAGNAGLAYPYGNTYAAASCNGNDYDSDCMQPDNDRLLATGSSYGCPPPATSKCVSPAGAFDMSGNVQEWTSTPKSAGVFSVRGGAFDTPSGGLTCQFDVVSFSHDFEFANLGFRCCTN